MRVIIFGDSFVEPYDHIDWVWTNQIKHKIKATEIKNYALGGSSIEYSLKRYYDYVMTDHQESDKIIFVLTDGHRSPIVHPDYNPSWASFVNSLHKRTKDNKKWYDKDTQKHYEDHMQFYKSLTCWLYDDDNHYKYFTVMNSLQNIPNDVVMLRSFEHIDVEKIIKFNNKSNLTFPSLSLTKVSKDEIKGDKLKLKMGDLDFNAWEHFLRPNHMMEANHNILAEFISKILLKENNVANPTFNSDIINESNIHKFNKEFVETLNKPIPVDKSDERTAIVIETLASPSIKGLLRKKWLKYTR